MIKEYGDTPQHHAIHTVLKQPARSGQQLLTPSLRGAQTYNGVWQGLKHIAKTEGLSGMMRGNLTNCIRIVPNQAVSIMLIVFGGAICPLLGSMTH